MVLVFIILAITIALFLWGKLRPDMVALLSMMALFLTGVIDTREALDGFADNTVILIAALFVVGEGISRSGIAAWLGNQIVERSGKSKDRLLLLIMLGTALLTAFIGNTGTVAIMIPVVVAAAMVVKGVPSKFLLPVAISANVAGGLTLISTPTNIIISDFLLENGQRPFGFFEFTIIGLPLIGVAIVYMLLWGKRLLPENQPAKPTIDLEHSIQEVSKTYSLRENIYWLKILPESGLVGQTLGEANIGGNFEVTVLHVEEHLPEVQHEARTSQIRGILQNLWKSDDSQKKSPSGTRHKTKPPIGLPSPGTRIDAGNMLLVNGEQDAIHRLTTHHNLKIEPLSEMEGTLADRLLSRELGFAEVVIPHRSKFAGRTVAETKFAKRFDLQVICLTRKNEIVNHRKVSLEVGDTLLIRSTWDAIDALRDDNIDFIVIGQPKAISEQIISLGYKAYLALGILIGMVILMITGIVPNVMAAIIAAIAMILLDVVTMTQAYRSISWNVLMLIGALFSMGLALEKTGGVEFMANGLVNSVGALGPLAMMAGIFLLSCGFSQILANIAAVILITPVAYQAALTMGVSPFPFMMMVAMGVNIGIMTPIAGAPMLLVMNPGQYKFSDYAKVSFPLVIMIFILSMIFVPLIWPLY